MSKKSSFFSQSALMPAIAVGAGLVMAAPMAMAAPLPTPTAEVATCTANPCAANPCAANPCAAKKVVNPCSPVVSRIFRTFRHATAPLCDALAS